MLVCDMSGTKKFKPIVIDKFADPRSLKNFDIICL